VIELDYQSSYEHPGHIFIALSRIMSCQFHTHQARHWSILIELLLVIPYT